MTPPGARRAFPENRWNALAALAGVLLFGFAVWVLSEMVDDTPKGEFRGWDEPVLRWVRGGPGSPQEAEGVVVLARAVTWLGSTPALSAVTVLALAWLGKRRRWRAAFVFAVVGGGAPLITNVLKHHFVRARPDIFPHLVSEESWSFPSGHALASAAIYLTLCVVLAGAVRRRAKKLMLVGAGFLVSFLVGVSRIYLGVHYPTDVIAGWSAGTIWALSGCAVLFAWEWLKAAPDLATKSRSSRAPAP